MRSDNPWRGPGAYEEVPRWRMERARAPYRVECPECGAHGRPYYVGPQSRDVRCDRCNFRFDPAGHCLPTTGKDKE